MHLFNEKNKTKTINIKSNNANLRRSEMNSATYLD